MNEWQPIATAPKAFVVNFPSGPTSSFPAIKNGREIMVRGDGEEFVAAWAQAADGEPYWVDLESGEPIDWPLSEWRERTTEELQSKEA